METGSVNAKPKSGRNSNEAIRETIVETILANPTTTQRNLALEVGTSASTVNRALHERGIKAYKYCLVQKLGEDDPDRRYHFCSWILSKPETFVRKIIFF